MLEYKATIKNFEECVPGQNLQETLPVPDGFDWKLVNITVLQGRTVLYTWCRESQSMVDVQTTDSEFEESCQIVKNYEPSVSSNDH